MFSWRQLEVGLRLSLPKMNMGVIGGDHLTCGESLSIYDDMVMTFGLIEYVLSRR